MIIIQGNVRHTNLNGQAVVEWSNEFRSFPRSSADRKAPHKEGSSKDVTSFVFWGKIKGKLKYLCHLDPFRWIACNFARGGQLDRTSWRFKNIGIWNYEKRNPESERILKCFLDSTRIRAGRHAAPLHSRH